MCAHVLINHIGSQEQFWWGRSQTDENRLPNVSSHFSKNCLPLPLILIFLLPFTLTEGGEVELKHQVTSFVKGRDWLQRRSKNQRAGGNAVLCLAFLPFQNLPPIKGGPSYNKQEIPLCLSILILFHMQNKPKVICGGSLRGFGCWPTLTFFTKWSEEKMMMPSITLGVWPSSLEVQKPGEIPRKYARRW